MLQGRVALAGVELDMRRHPVCRLDEIEDGAMKEVHLGQRSLLLIRSGSRIYALRNTCPHQGAKLSGGVLTGLAGASGVGRYQYSKVGQIVRCPWHNWEFDASDGRCLNNPDRARVACYDAEVENGQVFVSL